MEIGEKQGAGKSLGAEFDLEKGRAVWEVKVLGASGLQEFKVDAMSGQVVKVEEEHLRGRLTPRVARHSNSL
ncbi:PepSY domain-containing protein [Polaromonas sp.]|uniref:PepSY domain-containing protein n=1 Tax=Polaromonas sp. TaxID=1869339 RepID=UPI0032631BAD